MVVVYYTQTYYLDAVLELIQSIKAFAKLHLIIEVTPESKKSTIISIDSLGDLAHIVDWKILMKDKDQKKLESYFEGIQSVSFVVYKSKKSFSFSTAHTLFHLSAYFKKIKPDIIHFDTITIRVLPLFKFKYDVPICLSVHDPIPHSGEYSWKTQLVKRLFYTQARLFFFYSDYALQSFKKTFPHLHAAKAVLALQPYSFFNRLVHKTPVFKDYLLFTGRLSLYKGIDILLDAMPYVLKLHPSLKLVIAGRAENFTIPYDTIKQYNQNIFILNEYLSAEDLSALIRFSKFVICPYRDATQSGVLMTVFALGKTVVASRVGAFPEYIQDGTNGILADPEPIDLSKKILTALKNDHYLNLQQHVINDSCSCNRSNNTNTYKNMYRQLMA